MRVRQLVFGCGIGMSMVFAQVMAARGAEPLRDRLGLRPPTAVPVQPAPATQPPAPVPDQPAPPVRSGPEISGPQAGGRGDAEVSGGRGRILRGSQFVGLRVWDPQNQQLGTIKDVVIDMEGQCPTLFFAMSSDAVSDGLVFVPFDVVQWRFDRDRRSDYVILDIDRDQLRRAPRIEHNNWDIVRNGQFMTNARQFYRKTEHTTARPTGERGEGERRSDTGRRDSTERRPDADRQPGTETGPDANRQPRTDQAPDAGRAPDPGRQPSPNTERRPDSERQPGTERRPDIERQPRKTP